MLTLFTIPKPFRGHLGVIQRNAIRSWTLLHPRCEVILFGDDEGAASAAAQFEARHVPGVARNDFGTPLVSDIFAKAQRLASHDLLCYINADIIVTNDLLAAVSRVRKRRFLMIGQRWDLDVTTRLNFDDPNWQSTLKGLVQARGLLHSHTGLDYHVFHRNLWGELPPFAVGRTVYDNWLIWRARSLGVPVIDATRVVFCVHQNHDRSYSSLGMKAPDSRDDLTKGQEAQRNLQLAGGRVHMCTLRNATWILTARYLLPAITPKYLWARVKSMIRTVLSLTTGFQKNGSSADSPQRAKADVRPSVR